jgi:hypothetical protein
MRRAEGKCACAEDLVKQFTVGLDKGRFEGGQERYGDENPI